METWMTAELRRQSEALFRAGYDGHGRPHGILTMKTLKHRRSRRKANERLRTELLHGSAWGA